MPRLTKTVSKQVEEGIGYTCDICNKVVIFEHIFLPQFNTITWSFPSGNIGDTEITKIIYICSLECMLKALKNVYYGAHIELSYDFLEDARK